jgi:hypothetical protein
MKPTKLTPISSEVISKQATINIGNKWLCFERGSKVE